MLINPTPSIKILATFARPFRQGWHVITTWLVDNQDVQIRPGTNSLGQRIWKVYDPVTRKSAQLMSEQEVRIWLEQRHTVQPDPDFRLQLWAVDARL